MLAACLTKAQVKLPSEDGRLNVAGQAALKGQSTMKHCNSTRVLLVTAPNCTNETLFLLPGATTFTDDTLDGRQQAYTDAAVVLGNKQLQT